MKSERAFNATLRFRSLLLMAACALAMLFSVIQGKSASGQRSSYQDLFAQASQMQMDGAYLRAMVSAPRWAASRERPNDALLAQIQEGLEAAGIPTKDWIANEPHAPVRIPGSPYKKIAHSSLVRNMTMQQLASLVHHLTTRDPSLIVTQLRLMAAVDGEAERWDVTIVLAYYLYAPTQ